MVEANNPTEEQEKDNVEVRSFVKIEKSKNPDVSLPIIGQVIGKTRVSDQTKVAISIFDTLNPEQKNTNHVFDEEECVTVLGRTKSENLMKILQNILGKTGKARKPETSTVFSALSNYTINQINEFLGPLSEFGSKSTLKHWWVLALSKILQAPYRTILLNPDKILKEMNLKTAEAQPQKTKCGEEQSKKTVAANLSLSEDKSNTQDNNLTQKDKITKKRERDTTDDTNQKPPKSRKIEEIEEKDQKKEKQDDSQNNAEKIIDHSGGKSKDIQNQVILTYQQENVIFNMKKDEFEDLKPMRWFNDAIINIYLHSYFKGTEICVADTHFFQLVASAVNKFEDGKKPLKAAIEKRLQRIAVKFDALHWDTKKPLIIPVNSPENVHWALAVLHNKTFYLFDSFPHLSVGKVKNGTYILETLERGFRYYFHQRITLPTIDVSNSFRQVGTTDCGVFLCHFAKLLRNSQFFTSKNYVDVFGKSEMVNTTEKRREIASQILNSCNVEPTKKKQLMEELFARDSLPTDPVKSTISREVANPQNSTPNSIQFAAAANFLLTISQCVQAPKTTLLSQQFPEMPLFGKTSEKFIQQLSE